ncbi:MAG: S53 family peptidase, partial [Thermoplasmata archaeon]|nr:S53 family peptidase [Thermoplasmata archaeon]
SIPLLLTFHFSNATRLAALLGELQDTHSTQYRHYLSAAQFDQEFGESAASYTAAVQYVEALGAINVHTYSDRVSLSFDASPAVAQALFHAPLESYLVGGRSFYAPTSMPELPGPLASMVAGLAGLSSYSALTNRPLHTAPVVHSGGVPSAPIRSVSTAGYPSPVLSGGFQFEFSSDFQVAYDQLSLFAQEGYPTNMVAATILASGTYEGAPITTPWGALSTGQSVGPFVPRDIYDFYNETLPIGEPHATVTGVPLGGAPLPGPLASYDNTSANIENTLDLETLGSTAPGASIYNVYGSGFSTVDLDDAFAFILSPNASYPALNNVSVISNSWGGTDAFDAGWNASTAAAAARGITVLAASGDSGSNPNGDQGGFDPPGQTTLFPASMAYNTYGDVAVGGTTVTLDPSTLQMSSDIVWNQTAAFDSPGPAAGSTGGVSAIFPSPDWQNSTSADGVIGGAGRGVPDIAALANNTLMTITIGGVESKASNASMGGLFFAVAGTSIACPLTAGMIVDADHVLGAFHNSFLGFLDPTLYPLGNLEYEAVPGPGPGPTGYYVTGAYDSALPTLPFYDITVGRNFQDVALAGYDLVTGWGTIDAYNFTMYFVSYLPVNMPGDLSSLRSNFNLTNLAVTSPGVTFNASIQQNFFVANALGAPIYWVQNVIYINGTPGAWQMNFSGWVVYPFWGIYSNKTIYEYNFPLTGQVLATPLDFSIVTTLENSSVVEGQSVQFSFGVAGTSALSLPLPGGSYILGGRWSNYSWGGNLFSNNPLEGGLPGSLSPQFGIVGGPSGGQGIFTSPTAGNLQLEFQRYGSSQWVAGATAVYGESIDQTGESSSGLQWTETSPGNPGGAVPANWTLGISSGSTQQGVLEYDPATFVPTSPVTISETGLGLSEIWQFNLNTGQGFFTNSPQVVLALANGTYYWVAFPPQDYSIAPNHGSFTVVGTPVQVSLVFALVTYNVTLVALALPVGFVWWANVTETFQGSPTSLQFESNTTSITFAVANSSLDIAFAAQSNWTEQPHQQIVVVHGQSLVVDEAFAPPPKFPTTFVVEGLPAATPWTLAVSGQPNGTTTSAASLLLSLKNGSYSYVAKTNVTGFFAASGVFGVDGFAHEVFVSFLPAVYAVTFTESGLPAGSLWGLQILNGPYLSSEGSEVNWTAVNGTYNYTVLSEPEGWTAAPFATGQLHVNGSATTVNVVFSGVQYVVTFAMSGLPSSDTWGVSLDGRAANLTTSSSLTFSLPNGTYSYSITVPSGWSSAPGSGTFGVTGQGGTINLVATQASASSTALGFATFGAVLIAVIVVALLVAIGVALWLRRTPAPPKETGASPTESGSAPPKEET